MDDKYDLIKQFYICYNCIWKSHREGDKILCFFPRCIYERKTPSGNNDCNTDNKGLNENKPVENLNT